MLPDIHRATQKFYIFLIVYLTGCTPESSKRKVFIVTREETFEFYGKLNEIENSLKVCKISFFRVHQSFLVNYKHIKGQSYHFVVMDNGKKISISEDRRKLISEQYCSMEDTYYVDR